MKVWALLIGVALLVGCGGHRYDPDRFQVHFQPAAGVQGVVAEVGIPYRFGLLFTGPLPNVPVCQVIETDVVQYNEIRESCGMLVNRVAYETIVFTLGDYMMLNPPPYRDPMAGEYEQALPYAPWGAAEEIEPTIRIIVKYYYAEPDDTGRLKRTRYLTRVQSRGVRLSCRNCAW